MSSILNYHNLFEYQSLYSSLSPAYPCLFFSILCQSRILLIFLNLYIFLSTLIFFFLFCNIHHLYPFESLYFYPSTTYPYILFYLPSIHANPFLSCLQSLITTIFLNTNLFNQVYPPSIHVYFFQYFVNLESCLSFCISIPAYPH